MYFASFWSAAVMSPAVRDSGTRSVQMLCLGFGVSDSTPWIPGHDFLARNYLAGIPWYSDADVGD